MKKSAKKNTIKRKYSRFTSTKRGGLEKLLEEIHTLKNIAKKLEFTPAAVYYEITNHIVEKKVKGCNCANRDTCKIRQLCDYCRLRIKCRSCDHAAQKCPNFKKPYCDHECVCGLCNGCSKLCTDECHFTKRYYKADMAEKVANKKKRENRKGPRLNQEQIELINSVMTPLIREKGQSPAVVLFYHPELEISKSTFYRYVKAGYLALKPIDLQKLVKLKPRAKYDFTPKKLDPIPKEKNYEAFKKWKKENPSISWVEMDCVESVKGSQKTLLTLYFTKYSVQIAILLPTQSPKCVQDALDSIEKAVGHSNFQRLFPVILTDRGEEFRRHEDLEKSIARGKRTHIFYCDPYSSSEKAFCERNHEFIRMVLPDGTDFTDLTQDEVNIMMQHINSYLRETKKLVPIDRALKDWSPSVLSSFGLQKIQHDDVTLTPSLLEGFYRRTGQDPIKLQDIMEGKVTVEETIHKY